MCAQLESRDEIQATRHAIWRRYDEALNAWAAAAGVGRPYTPAHCAHPAHMYYLLMPSLAARTRFIAHLRARMVLAVFHYQPLHLSDKGREYGGRPGQCPVTEDVSDRLVRLPLFFDLGEADQARVIEAVTSFQFAG